MRVIRLATGLPSAMLGLGLPGIALGATINVNTTADVIDGSGDCSLREAVLAANTDTAIDGCAAGDPTATAVDEIVVPAGTYTLAVSGIDEGWQASDGVDPFEAYSLPDAAFGDLDLTDSARVVGAGSDLTVIQWDGGDDRVFHVVATGADDIEVTLVGLTARGGSVGAEVINPGDPTEWEYARLGGAVASGPGGVVAAIGASGPGDEGGPPDDHEDSAGASSLVLVDVVVADSYAAGGGGGLFSGGALTADGLKALYNVTDKNGGGVYQEGQTFVTASQLVGNAAEGGGAFFATGPTDARFDDTLIADNQATGGGGVSIRALVQLELHQSTIRGNAAGDVGGGLYGNGAFRLFGSTVVENSAASDAGFGGGGITVFAQGSASLRSSILAANINGADTANCGCTGGGCSPANGFSSEGYNLEDGDTCDLTDGTDLVGVDPMLTPFGDYGGLTMGYLPMPGSPAIDAGDLGTTAANDGRGGARSEDGDGDGTSRADIGAFELSLLEVDGDADGWCPGLSLLGGAPTCLPGAQAGDCDDLDPVRFPGNPEVCDGLDNDCNAAADDGLPFADYYPDADSDTYGDPGAAPLSTCDGPPAGYVADATDCNDTLSTVFPGNPEVCDGLDNDCSAAIDDGLPFVDYFPDADGDTYGDLAASPVATCDGPPAGYVADATDCDDALAEVFPGNPEVCDGLDNDCNAQADDTLTFEDWYPDADADGYGDLAATPAATCDGPPTGYVADATDCDDASGSVFPGADELCNTADDDCDGTVDEDDAIDAPTWYLDEDGDGYGVDTTTEVACAAPDGFVDDATDCDDVAAGVNPGAEEVFDNDIDDDCDGAVDKDDTDFKGGCGGCDGTGGVPTGAAGLAALLGILIRRRRA